MKNKNIELINSSIQKWEDILNHGGKDMGIEDCPLCQEYLQDSKGCTDCPVFEYTGPGRCLDTPYSDWCAYASKHGVYTVFDDKSKELAKAEKDFLEELLVWYIKGVECEK